MIRDLSRTVQAVLSLAQRVAARHPGKLIGALTAVLLGGTGFSFALAHLPENTEPVAIRHVAESVQALQLNIQSETLDAQSLRLYRSEITRGTDTADTLLRRLGIFDPQAAAFLRSDAQVMQNLLGRSGRNVTVEAAANNALIKLQARWSTEDNGMFKRLTVEQTPKGYVSRLETLPLSASSRLASGTIQSSLFAATDSARVPDSIAIQLADIFSGDIDFQRALRKGDRFTVVYETLEGDGEPLRAGRVLSAEFVNAGKTHQAMWFQEPVATGSATKGAYYTLAGESLRRAFLASPLEFSRITSGFQMRFHPILKLWKAHLGVDYGASTGTPVRSVGDGVVEFAGVQTGFGNVVMLRHANQIETVYAHLSRINVKQGQNVSQGQNVGLVGATGWATGPHLHFEFRINGVHHDPQTIARKNESRPVAAAYRNLFIQTAAQVRDQLTAAAQMQSGSVE